VATREGQFHLQVKVADAFRLSEEALIVIGGRIAVRDRVAGRLVATIPWNMKSWGETVEVNVEGADGSVFVHFRSESRVPTTRLDWGQSADNLKRFGDWVNKTPPT
jgi:hypothetical protein